MNYFGCLSRNATKENVADGKLFNVVLTICLWASLSSKNIFQFVSIVLQKSFHWRLLCLGHCTPARDNVNYYMANCSKNKKNTDRI